MPPPSALTLDYSRPPSPKPGSVGRRLAWAFGIVVALGLLGSILLPSLCKAREPANRAKCSSNLHQIGLAILLYQQDNAGLYPDTLGRLTLNEQIGSEVFTCPSGADEKSTAATPEAIAAEIDAGTNARHCSYRYFGRGLTDKTATPTTVIACDVAANHDDDGGNVLYGDGHADWQTKAELARLLPPTPTTAPAR